VNGASAIATCCAANPDYLARVLPGHECQDPADPSRPDVEVFTRRHRKRQTGIPIISLWAGWSRKRVPGSLEAFGLLKQAGFLFCGMIYGDGPLRENWLHSSTNRAG
jgi:hypothetical protein